MWFKLHRVVQSVGLVFTLIALAVAIAMVAEEGEEHFGGVHGRLGLAVTIAGKGRHDGCTVRRVPLQWCTHRHVSSPRPGVCLC